MSKNAQTALLLVKADLLAGDEFWDQLMREHQIDLVIHSASPFFTKMPEDENEMIRPAVDGTNSVIRACVSNKIKRAVVTSSVAAVWNPAKSGETLTDKNWSIADRQDTYSKSKTLAEQAAWACVKDTETELVTVNPGAIYGPTLYNDSKLIEQFESGSFVLKLLAGGLPVVPRMKLGVVDVRDVAAAQVAALTASGAAGQRVLLTPTVAWFRDVADVFKNSVPGLKFSCRQLPDFVVHAYGRLTCAPDYKVIRFIIGIDWNADSSKYTEILKCKWTPVEDTAKDMLDDFIELDCIKDPAKERRGA